ncbi:hypothetical protein [Gloeobacter morelensis]|uniref:FecR protein domain-containing protein n=1 Tax=Gloeobacter morelensis MG652769 TaxID=2781736 RepID=A0ABY3PPY3_9CYAN|nr:hypothetical protein [Gloeobacter morelensis]UFP95762.1 hypothetical protein ISF26_05890 [Gloeobacter morelensis MG652769]
MQDLGGRVVAVAAAVGLFWAGVGPLQAAPDAQLQKAVIQSGLAGERVRLSRARELLTIETGQLYTDSNQLKLVLVGLANLVGSRDKQITQVKLRAQLLGEERPVEATVPVSLAGRIRRQSSPAGLKNIALAPFSGDLSALASEPAAKPRPAISTAQSARPHLPVIGEPLMAGQPVADAGRGDESQLVHAGNAMLVRLDQEVSLASSPSVAISAVVDQPVVGARGTIVIPRGSRVHGAVEKADGGAQLVIRELEIDGSRYAIAAASAVIYTPLSGGSTSPVAHPSVMAGYGGFLVGGPIGGLLGVLLGGLAGPAAAPPRVYGVPAGPLTVRLTEDLRTDLP